MDRIISLLLCSLLFPVLGSPLLLSAEELLGTKNGEFLGTIDDNCHDPDSINNPYGAGSPYRLNSINNPFGPYGSEFSDRSATNPYARNPPRIYDEDGNFRGKLSANPYDSDSTSNPFGRYGNPLSPYSINNPFAIQGRRLRVIGQR